MSNNLEKLYEGINAADCDSIRSILGTDASLINSVKETPPPLHWAIYQGDPTVVRTLLDFDPNLELQDQDRDATPLDYAIVYNRKDLISMIIAKGGNTDGRMATAKKGAAGGFEEFTELPPRAEYAKVVQLLQDLGVTD